MTSDEIKEHLKQVKYPGFSRDIVSFGLVRAAALVDGTAKVSLALTTVGCKLKLDAKVKGFKPDTHDTVIVHVEQAGAEGFGEGIAQEKQNQAIRDEVGGHA